MTDTPKEPNDPRLQIARNNVSFLGAQEHIDVVNAALDSLHPSPTLRQEPEAADEGFSPLVELPGHRGTIDLREVEQVLPRGDYADECTLVMRSGARWSVGHGYDGSASKSMRHWAGLVDRAKAGGGSP